MQHRPLIAAWIVATFAAPLAAAAQAAPPSAARTGPSSAAELVVAPANRSLFRQCAAGRDAAAALAERRDDATLANADSAFARCTRTSIDPSGVAAAELGIAATAYLAAQSRTGDARRAALARAADYAQRADERWRSWHQIGIPSGRGGIPTVETRPGSDAGERVEVGLPGGPTSSNGAVDGARAPDYRTPADARPAGFEVLALGIADQARAQSARAARTK